MISQMCLPLIPPGYITPEEALARRQITKKQYERIIYGGLSKKHHDRMMNMAIAANREFRRAVLAGKPTRYGFVDPAELKDPE